MPISMYAASVPVFVRTLEALTANLAKGKAHLVAKKVDPSVVMGARLIADMLPFSFQVRTCADFAKNTTARLAGVAVPVFEDNEATLNDLAARIERTVTFLKSADRASIDAAADREITFPVGGRHVQLPGVDYLVHFALPNFHFHATMAFALLRLAGVDIGKIDFMGRVPGFEQLRAA